jgi:HAD superfamily hydrolase (TIGR01484 family)
MIYQAYREVHPDPGCDFPASATPKVIGVKSKIILFNDYDWSIFFFIDEISRKKIIDTVNKVYEESSYYPKKIYGEIVEDRWSQITLSALGQEAPLEAKEKWDPDQEKRKDLIEKMEVLLPEFYLKLGGTTSIDITKKWIDKAFGMNKLMEIVSIKKEEIVFVGDALYEGWNDYPVAEMWIKSLLTSWVEDTKTIIKHYLSM